MIRKNIDWAEVAREFRGNAPFDHAIIDDFLDPAVARAIGAEFPGYAEPMGHYDSPLENKKLTNEWNRFGPNTYRAFLDFGSPELVSAMRLITGDDTVQFDFGLHGGGLHLHSRGGRLNIHLDYNIHPKLGKQRKVNIIVYLTPDWQPEWNGGLQLWSHNAETNRPDACVKKIENKFNRAVIFDTTQNSWHGLPDQIICPEGVVRRSLAIFYVCDPAPTVKPRMKALFAPRPEQIGDPEIEDLIKKRSDVQTAAEAYTRSGY